MDIQAAAHTLREYLQLHQEIKKCDAIIALWSSDIRVAKRAADLYNQWVANLVVTAGGGTKVRTDIITLDKPEAEVFADILIEYWVPPEHIITESSSTNTGENIQFVYRLLQDKAPKSLLFVHKTFMERRAIATLEKQWPDHKIELSITSPVLTYDEYCEWFCDEDYLINMVVWEVQRMLLYPDMWYIMKQGVPESIIYAYKFLKEEWYTKQLIKK